MRRLSRLAGLAVVAVALSAGGRTASADGAYFSESFGGADVKDDLSAYMSNAFRVRIAGGYRAKQLAFELWFAGDLGLEGGTGGSAPPPPGYEITTPRAVDGGYGGGYSGGGGTYSTTNIASYGMDVKYLQPLARNVDVYIRGGLAKGYVDTLNASGRGLDIGAGIQAKGKVSALGLLFWPLFFTGVGPKITLAGFVDSGYEFYRFQGATHSTDGSLSHLTFGFALGSDF